jgi:NAD-dependent deacetylase
LDQETIEKSVLVIHNADLLIVAGTSLTVYPAAAFLDEYPGNRLVLINLQPTGMDSRADLVIQGKIGEVLGQIQVR